jgi:hypothetical protein
MRVADRRDLLHVAGEMDRFGHCASVLSWREEPCGESLPAVQGAII